MNKDNQGVPVVSTETRSPRIVGRWEIFGHHLHFYCRVQSYGGTCVQSYRISCTIVIGTYPSHSFSTNTSNPIIVLYFQYLQDMDVPVVTIQEYLSEATELRCSVPTILTSKIGLHKFIQSNGAALGNHGQQGP